MNKTPRTDEQILHHDNGNGHPSAFVYATFARQLELDLAEAQTEVERLALEVENRQYTITCASEENQQLKESLAEARAEVKSLKDDKHTNLKEILQLRHDVTEARAEIERLKEWEYCMKTQAPYEAAGATWELRHKHDQAVIAERDKLIEQMREALVAAKNDGKMLQSAITYQLIRAALSAAERGKI